MQLCACVRARLLQMWYNGYEMQPIIHQYNFFSSFSCEAPNNMHLSSHMLYNGTIIIVVFEFAAVRRLLFLT